MAAMLAEVCAEDTTVLENVQTRENSVDDVLATTPIQEKSDSNQNVPIGDEDASAKSLTPSEPSQLVNVGPVVVSDSAGVISSIVLAAVPSSVDSTENSMPQWKKELIQRRKTNVARTIGANQIGTCPQKATNPSVATSPVISMAKMVYNDGGCSIKNNSNATIADQSGVNARTPDIIQPSGSASSSGHYTPANGSCEQQQQQAPPLSPQLACVVNSGPAAALFNGKPKTVGAVGTSNPNSLTGNDGLISGNANNNINECNSGGTTSGTCLTTSQQQQQQNQQSLFRHSQQPDSIVGQQFQLHSRLDVERCISEPSESCAIATGTSFIKNPTVNKTNNKLIKYKNNSGRFVAGGINNNNTGANVKSVLLSPNANSGTKKMVAAQELSDTANDAFDFDPSEELQYGPGIVSKLRCRYLSLALRQSAGKQRPNLDNLRRATSLNNLLDDDDRGSNSSCTTADNSSNTPRPDTDLTKSPDEFVATFQKNLKISDKQRSRHVKRGNDSLKRARSVEALLVSDKSWDNDSIAPTNGNGFVQLRCHQRIDENSIGSPTTDITIEDKIICARERNSLQEKPPKRLSSFMDDTERPPPDVVKQTLKIFEATANRRGRGLSRNNFSGEVAAKVANYKSIISQEKPPIIYPKPPLSPKKNFRKPANLDIVAAKKINNLQQTTVTNNIKKSHPASPISNVPKKFASATAHSESITNDSNEKQLPPSQVQSPSPPIPSIRTDLPFRHSAKNESTPLRATLQSPLTPDIIPRRILDTSNPALIDSPVSQLSKQIERLRIESPTSPSPTIALSPSNNAQRKSSESDDSLDGESSLTKRISKLALENISKAGTTQQFSFNNKITNNKLPLVASSTVNVNNLTAVDQSQVSNPTTISKQVGVIRPLIAEPKLLQPTDKLKSSSTVVTPAIAAAVAPPPDYTSAVDEITAKTRDNLVISNLSQQSSNNTNNFSTNNISCSSNNSSKIQSGLLLQAAVDDQQQHQQQQRPALTSREIEKNLINAKKSEQANFEATNNDTKWQFTKKKTRSTQQQQQQATQNNTMVFNFKDRKEVPDYIENDGLLFKRKRELPKPNESGFVLLGDLSLETSTDPEDDWTMGPPSPCDVEFENANIIIDGKSSIQRKTKDVSLRVQFDDTLTSTFEYPSESSLFEESFDNANTTTENVGHVVTAEEIVKNPGQKLLGSMSLGSAPLGSYTPMKAQINTSFELGVTRAPAPSLKTVEKASSDEFLKNNGSSNGNSSDNELTTGKKITTTTSNNSQYNSNGSVNYILNGSSGCSDEPESLQYLKPVSDDLTVVYSEGTQKADLLY